jgi:hypothetical protein
MTRKDLGNMIEKGWKVFYNETEVDASLHGERPFYY